MYCRGDFNLCAPQTPYLHWLNNAPWSCLNSLFAPGTSTFQHVSGSTSCIDFVYVNQAALKFVKHLEVETIHTQGHSPIFVTFHTKSSFPALVRTHEFHRACFEKADCKGFSWMLHGLYVHRLPIQIWTHRSVSGVTQLQQGSLML